jgi:hypothetical protein
MAGATTAVFPGHRAAMSPEPMTTRTAKEATAAARRQTPDAAFMGSGLAPAARPGMTEAGSTP